ncbi:GNAT family N-acetyltransferase [Lentibacillus sediminis]|uniref:GNAT family N-acetyltransferase n=1 Tax=Lentibacillus sediminis TaxID=1940529 RepID=UPI000C1C363A|nr:GNAT family N-acetyltransferase [Lentibacillus sediminis]
MIRHALPEDARQLVKVMQQVERESPYMLYEAGEREISAENMEKRIRALTEQENSIILLAETDGQLAGYLFAIGGSSRKSAHTASVVIGVTAAHQGKGLGTRFFEKLEKWAMNIELHRLELTVITENTRAIDLYEKAGFTIEGAKKDALRMDGRFVDEYYMSKLLEG